LRLGKEAVNVAETIVTFFGVLVAFVGGLFYWLPRLSHRELFFAVTVRAEFPASDTGQAILQRYGARVVLVTLAAVGCAVAGGLTARLWLALLAPLLQLAGCFWAFLGARSATLGHAVAPTTLREAQVEPRGMRVPGGWGIQLAPFAILAAAGAALRWNWQRIPARFPVHWAIGGRPNNWSTRVAAGVYGPLWLGAATVALLVLLSWAIGRWTRRLHASGAAAAAELVRERRYLLVLVFTEYIVAIITSWTALLPLRSDPARAPSAAVPLGLLAILLLALLLLFVAHRPPEPLPAEGAPTIGDRTEDRYWKAGVCYFNRNDPAILVEKRFGIGYTLNFGHWISWAILAVLLLLPLSALFLAHHHV
jgi:uncharacterized membrane protein